jgi:hypothetical protein
MAANIALPQAADFAPVLALEHALEQGAVVKGYRLGNTLELPLLSWGEEFS